MKPIEIVAAMSTTTKPSPALLKRAKELRKVCSISYYDVGSSALSDHEFDKLEDSIKKADPKWVATIGAPVQNKKKARKLVVPCASLDKIKAEIPKSLDRFLAKFEGDTKFRVEAKIDGASLIGHYENLSLKTLSTRGDAGIGQSVDGCIPASARTSAGASSGLVVKLVKGSHPYLALRFEASMRAPVYRKKFADKFDSTRVIASSAFNRSVPDSSVLSQVDFILIEGWARVGSRMKVMSSSELDVLSSLNGFLRPQSTILPKSRMTVDTLSNILKQFRGANRYDLDGLVLRPTNNHELEPEATGENPEFVKAFKVNDVDSALETTVEEIIWNVSSFGVLVPKALITPIQFGKVTVKHAALHNVSWAKERGAGVGAVVRVLRSGEIIPKIVEVVAPAKFTLPSKKEFGDYHMIGKKLTLVSKETASVRAKKISRMFGLLKMDSLGLSLASKMVEAGFDTTQRVCLMSEEDVQSLPGIKGSAGKIAKELTRVRSGEFTAARLFLASGVADAGMGATLLSKLVKSCPEVFSSSVKRQDVLSLTKILGPAFASTFASAWPKFLEWMKEVRPKVADLSSVSQAPTSGPLSGQFFSWTGYRSDEEVEFVTSRGGEVISNGKKTSVLFYKAGGKFPAKVEAAGERAQLFSEWRKKVK